MSHFLGGPSREERPAPPFSAEAPINSDSEDVLVRTGFADELARLLSRWSGDHSLVVALRGAWGEGKTSLKNLVVNRLAATSPRPDRLEFNPWRYGDSTAITTAFYREVSIALRGRGGSPDDLRRAHWFRTYGKLLGPTGDGARAVSNGLTGFLGWLVSVGLLAAGAGTVLLGLPITTLVGGLAVVAGALGVLGKVVAAINSDDTSKPIELVRHDLRKHLKRRRTPLVVIIDDIDRLDHEEIQTIFRHVKANADLPNLTYLLLFQRSIVERALDGVSDNHGREFLAKIVQASFDLPTADSASILQVFLRALEKIFDGYADQSSGFEQVRWGNILHGGIKPYLGNLRDVHRLISSLSVHLELHKGDRVLEVNAVDFIAIETLRLFEPDVFNALPHQKNLLTGSSTNIGGSERERIDKSVKSIVQLARDDRKDRVEDILNRLFPPIRWVFNNTHYGPDHIAGWSEARRVCTERYFDRYFSLRISGDDISDSEMLNILEDAKSVEAIRLRLDDLWERGLLKTLFLRLDEMRDRLPLEHFQVFAPALMGAAERLGEEDSFGMEAASISAWRSVYWYLRQEPDQARRGELFLGALRETDGLAVAATILSLDRDKRSEKPEEDLLLTDAHLAEAQSRWVKNLRDRWEDRTAALADHRFRGYLYRWSEFAEGDGEVRAFVSGLVHRRDTLLPLLRRFHRLSRSQTMGDLVSRIERELDLKALETFIDLEEVRTEVLALDRTGMKDEDLALVEEVLKSLPNPDPQPLGRRS